MKSERRHELQHNILADWLFENYEKIRPYGNTIVGVIAVVGLIFAGWLWWTRQSAVDRSAAWGNLFIAQASGQPDRLADVAEKYSATSAAGWATVVAGDMFLMQGCEQLFQNKNAAIQDLNKAVDSYQKARKSEVSVLQERAAFGLGRAYEALSGTSQSSSLDKAIQSYEEVVKRWPNGVYVKAAEARLKELKDPATKKFYDQFAKFDPKPAFTDEKGKPGDQLLFDPSSLPQPGSVPASAVQTTPAPAKPEATPAATPEKPAAPASVPAAPPVNQ